MSASFSPAIREFMAAPADARRLGPYRCKDVLDQTGAAPVFKAVEEHAGHGLREVAVKVFDIARGGKRDAWQARVLAEARALCRVQHPNVIRFHTLVTDPKRGLMGLVMELASGIDLDRELRDVPRGDARRVALAVQAGIDIASALSAAHAAGVLHCNVKPSNIMLTDGTHKLINFGIAATLRPDGDDDAPRPEGASGTPGYVDPVSVRTGAAAAPSSDLYGLGATLYTCITGAPPAKSADGDGLDGAVLSGEAPPRPLAEAAPSAPVELAKVVDALVSPAREARPKSADAVLRALERVRSVLAGHDRALPPEERGPFPGLDRYEDADRDVFFGRSAEVAGVLELARSRGLVGIVGLSGTGKSSLARAGVVPAVREGALEGWPKRYESVLVTPGDDLMSALDAALSKVLGGPLAGDADAIVAQLSEDVDAKGRGIVLLVDQLEELLRSDEARATAALDLLARFAEDRAGLRAVVIVRRDHLDEVLALDPHFSRALSRSIHLLAPLGAAAWGEIVDAGLSAYGYRFEDAELREEILADVRDHEAAMPLVGFGLARLWAARDAKDKTIPRSAFRAKEGMRGALERHADATVDALDVPRETLRDVIVALTTPEGTRAHVSLDALVERHGEPARDVVRALERARLVIEERAGFAFVHDAVLREWGRVRGWIEAARDDRLLFSLLERDAARWRASRDPAELWRKGRLAAAVEIWKRGGLAPSDAAQEFLKRSFREEQKAQYAFWGLVFVIVFMIVGGSLFYAKTSRERAEAARRDADALAAALAEVKALKREAEESAGEAAATAKLLQELQAKMAAERNAYGKNVKATLEKVATATSLDSARKATADLSAQAGPAQNQVVPLPMDLVGGPSMPKLDTSGPSPSMGGGGGAFDQGAIERVVNSRKAGVKRTCLERSGGGGGGSTKVTATLTIAPNGSVRDVSSTGNDPVVGKCIEQQLRTWTFPAPGETQQVQIPFVFVRQ